MNKILRFSVVALLAMMGMGNAMAEEVKFDFTDATAIASYGLSAPTENGAYTEFSSCTYSGVTINATDGSTSTRIFKSNPQTGGEGELTLRIYKGGSMTISAGFTIQSIVFTGKDTKNLAAEGCTNGTWTGSASSVTFTVSGTTQIKTITISSSAGETPTTKEVNVAQALEVINALADNATTEDEYQVTGFVLDVTEKPGTYQNITFIIADDATATTGLTVFRADKFNEAAITNPDLLKKGDKVVVKGKLQKYVKNGVTTPEVAKGGVILSINGKTEDSTPNPEDAITNGKDASSPMSVNDALGYINDFSDEGFVTANKYYVKGTVSEVTEINLENGNATFKMGDLVCFRLKGLEEKLITTDNYVKANDEVIVYARLQKYKSGETITPELSGGYIYSLNGKTQEDVAPYTPTGNGTQANPYTAEDVKHLTLADPAEKAWVTGVIIGTAKSANALHAGTETDADVASNIALAADASSTEFIPVKLKAGGEDREKLNLVDNPTNKGKTVQVYGLIAKYFSTNGVTDIEKFVLDGTEYSGITAVTSDANTNAPIYNVAGQRVNQGYKGLVIKSGSKYVNK